MGRGVGREKVSDLSEINFHSEGHSENDTCQCYVMATVNGGGVLQW